MNEGVLVGYASWNDGKTYRFDHRVYFGEDADKAARETEQRLVRLLGGKAKAQFTKPLEATNWYGAIGAVKNGELHTDLVELACDDEQAENLAMSICHRTFLESDGFTGHGISINKLENVVEFWKTYSLYLNDN